MIVPDTILEYFENTAIKDQKIEKDAEACKLCNLYPK